MPKISKLSADHIEDHGVVVDRHADFDGYTVNIVSFNVDLDGGPMLQGLPGDSCSCPHLGYVTKGRVTFRFAEREETFEEGDAFYVAPGHVPVHEAGSEYVQFSPADQLRPVSEHLAAAARRMMQSQSG